MPDTPMRYITRLRIENFQSHKDTELTLEPGINLIVGSSDSGKSAILRAVNWLFHNPRNVSYVRKGTEEARVTAWFNDGTMVSRIKGKQRNGVTIHLPDGTDYAFEKIGAGDLPPEAIKALGNPPVDKVHGPISYSSQLGGYFLVSLGSTELPRSISELTGIDDFEEAAQKLGQRTRSADKAAKESKERVDGYEEQLEKYADLEEQLENLEKLEDKARDIEAKFAQDTAIENLLSKYEILRETGRKTSLLLKKSRAVTQFEDKATELKAIKNQIQSAQKLIENYNGNLEQESKARIKIDKINRMRSADILTKVESANKLNTDLTAVDELLTSFTELKAKGSSIKAKAVTWKNKYDELVQERNELLIEMKANGLWCENCDRPLEMDNCKGEK